MMIILNFTFSLDLISFNSLIIRTLEYFQNVDTYKNFMMTRIKDIKTDNLKIFNFFNDKHRAELLKNMSFSPIFVKK